MAGYSNMPLAKKLGVKDGDALWLRHAPSAFQIDRPPNTTLRRRRSARVDIIVAFFTRSADLASEIEDLATVIFPSASLWIAWPKRASGISTDLADTVVRDLALPLGLVDNKVCAIDETWSGLRVVWRLDRRTNAPKRGP
jgi:hypothetical protein